MREKVKSKRTVLYTHGSRMGVRIYGVDIDFGTVYVYERQRKMGECLSFDGEVCVIFSFFLGRMSHL